MVKIGVDLQKLSQN